MRALQVALDALRAEHAAVERKVFPRLEADDLVVLDLELDAALLAAEAAVRLDQAVRLDAASSSARRPSIDRQMRAELVSMIAADRRAGFVAIGSSASLELARRRHNAPLRQAEAARAGSAGRSAGSARRRSAHLVARSRARARPSIRSSTMHRATRTAAPQRRHSACSPRRRRPCRSSTPSWAGRWKMWKNLPNGSHSSVKITVTAWRMARKS